MRRTFGIDVLECPRCGGRLRLMALIEHTQIVDRILRYLGLPTDRPEARPPRAPPLRGDDRCQFDLRRTRRSDPVSGFVSPPVACPTVEAFVETWFVALCPRSHQQ